ncbi:MAG: DJ-1/PfpI family protein [Rhizobiales bacterium]|nr:DJ-1/PfpI family protein [Hyphomicrobiales bacterium]
MTAPLSIVFPLYAGMTHLDFTGPHQFLSRLPGATLTVASVGGLPVKADGLTFADLARLEEIAGCDVLCVPGGSGCTHAMQDPVFMAAIRRLAAGARYVTSVCTGSLILGAAGLLEGRRAACHWAWREFLPLFGAIPDGGRVVRDGSLITGGGVTAGIDFAITVAAELADARIAQAIQLGLEYAPAPPFNSGHPDTAPAEIYTMVASISGANNKVRRAQVEQAAEAYAAGKRAA